MIENNVSSKIKYHFMLASIVTILICSLFTDGYVKFEKTGNNYFKVYLNDQFVGNIDDDSKAQNLLVNARRNMSKSASGMVFIDADLRLIPEEVLFGKIDSDSSVITRMQKVLMISSRATLKHAYTVKINEYMVNLESVEEVKKLLDAAVAVYDSSGKYETNLVQDYNRDFDVLVAHVVKSSDLNGEDEKLVPTGGIQQYLDSWGKKVITEDGELDFTDYELGVLDVSFDEDIEISEGYMPASEIQSLEQAIEEVTKEQETPGEYTVQSGDTLSEISMNLGIPIETIIEMNPDKLEDINSKLKIGDALTITVPEPELSVRRVERVYVEEVYDAPVQYIDRDDWYTTQKNVIQQPSAGFRKAILDISYINNEEQSRDVLKAEVLMEAVPKIVERGTKVPPTYIKPISGGRLTSKFGYRKSSSRYVSSYHKGVDWGTPTGTSVYASSGGTVQKAGWMSGYGYAVYIKHPDGSETRYAHLSRVLVSSGQTVKQGDKIALSGNTGNSTGPHLHFEILLGGKQVNPLNYLN